MSASIAVNWSALAVLRFVLAWIVLAHHYEDFVPGGLASVFAQFGGNAAVVGFLLISGFSIAASIEKRPEGFLFRRLVRIYPMYLAALLMTLAVQRYVVSTAVGEPIFPADDWATIAGNLLLVQMFLCKALAYNGPFWSLSIEFSFYVLAPLFFLLPRKYLWLPIVFSGLVYTLPDQPDAGLGYLLLTKFNALRYLWAWLLGFVIYANRSRTMSVVGFGVCMVVLPQSDRDYISPVTLVTVGVSYLFLLWSQRFQVGKGLAKVFNFLGDLSYPLYLVHFPVAVLLTEGLGVRHPGLFYALCFVVSWLCIVVFDGVLKKVLFKPMFARFFASRAVKLAVGRLPQACVRSYVV